MITTRLIIGLIQITDDNFVHVREDTIYEENNVELTRVYHRRVISPIADISGETSQRLIAIVNAARSNP